MLSAAHIRRYRDQGYLLVEGVLDAATLARVNGETDRLIAAAGGLDRATHLTDDLYDLEDSHRPDAPRVRRLKRPDLVSPVFGDLVRHPRVLQILTGLLGPDVRLQTTKLNVKAAGYGAAVEWHQDWAFYPCTNDSGLAIGVMLSDTGPDNGPLLVYPGSHTGPTHDHHHNGRFVGAMDLAASGLDPADAVAVTGPAGAVSVHHVRLVHGSDLNRSARDRRMLFMEYMAADAWPIAGGRGNFESLEEFNSRMVAGSPTLRARLEPAPVRIPLPQPETYGSIYEIQKGVGHRAFAVADDH
ncbi:MAG: phytanoyl-CoA dioxygenase family protein [Alphaproteobacteria bacterium]